MGTVGDKMTGTDTWSDEIRGVYAPWCTIDGKAATAENRIAGVPSSHNPVHSPKIPHTYCRVKFYKISMGHHYLCVETYTVVED